MPASNPSSTSTSTVAEGGIPAISVLRLRGAHDEQAEAAVAQDQAGTGVEQQAIGLRTDREYPEAYEGPNPDNWPVERGVPDYRPLHRDRDAVSRPLGATQEQRVFVSLMMAGVFTIGKLHSAWTATVGRVNGDLFKYPVGGQF
ncbi:hypothetical protein BCR35DRAFT_302387 [Leucosporidium creatinivorum]|uniref:Uncharacterized protein n=1 Tax=Leucosporidium creatinivorum TaxID=106004 RepID=A0A1Y2FRN1_9BASI|nr:hypothetical protein BCR35DRAFT_302387 [Leucosporidium creatinivorum]